MGIGADEKKPLLVQLDGQYYDIADFAPKHPGGAKVTFFQVLGYFTNLKLFIGSESFGWRRNWRIYQRRKKDNGCTS